MAEPVGSMVIDIGGGTTDIAVLSMGGNVISDSLRIAGNTFDQEIVRYVRSEFNLLIGDRTAEEIKREVGDDTSNSPDEHRNLEESGRELLDGMPKTIQVETD